MNCCRSCSEFHHPFVAHRLIPECTLENKEFKAMIKCHALKPQLQIHNTDEEPRITSSSSCMTALVFLNKSTYSSSSGPAVMCFGNPAVFPELDTNTLAPLWGWEIPQHLKHRFPLTRQNTQHRVTTEDKQGENQPVHFFFSCKIWCHSSRPTSTLTVAQVRAGLLRVCTGSLLMCVLLLLGRFSAL